MSTGWFQIATSNGMFLLDASSNDVLVRTEGQTQRLLMGCGSNLGASAVVSRDKLAVPFLDAGILACSNQLTVTRDARVTDSNTVSDPNYSQLQVRTFSCNGPQPCWLKAGASLCNFGYVAAVADGNVPLVLQPNGGSVGVGTTTPGQTLEVRGGVRCADGFWVGSNQVINGATQVTASQVTATQELTAPTVSVTGSCSVRSNLVFSASNSNSHIVFPNADATSTQGRRVVVWDLGNNAWAGMGKTVGALHFRVPVSTDVFQFNAASAELMRLAGNGNLGIGTNNPNYKLSVQGDVYATGTVLGNQSSVSDVRLKSNIVRLTDCLHKVRQLSGYTFDMSGHGRLTGLLAQEVQPVLPEAVGQTKEGHLTVAYGNILGLLVEAIKELDDKLAAGSAL
jgi:hypothetical protein